MQTYIDRLFDREGEFSLDRADRGGATRWGITRSTLAFWRGRDVTVEDVQQLSKEEAAQIYTRLYFENHRIGLLPDVIEEQVFDFGVNSGPGVAIMALQECLGVKADGIIGPKTVAACITACQADGGRSLNIKLAGWRILMLARICRRDPSQIKWLGGWLRRSLEFAR